jgi:hypothetical protein
VLSHGHFDHTTGMDGLIRTLGKANVPVLIHPEFWSRLTGPLFDPIIAPPATRSPGSTPTSSSPRTAPAGAPSRRWPPASPTPTCKPASAPASSFTATSGQHTCAAPRLQPWLAQHPRSEVPTQPSTGVEADVGVGGLRSRSARTGRRRGRVRRAQASGARGRRRVVPDRPQAFAKIVTDMKCAAAAGRRRFPHRGQGR